jgi:hypothetical protein
LDEGIKHYVEVLQKAGVETCQSCQGGPGHTYLEPTIEFGGGSGAGLHALSVAITHNFPVSELRRVWRVESREIVEVMWVLTFHKRADTWCNEVKERENTWIKNKRFGRDATWHP